MATDLLSAIPEGAKARVGRNTLDLEALAFQAGGSSDTHTRRGHVGLRE